MPRICQWPLVFILVMSAITTRVALHAQDGALRITCLPDAPVATPGEAVNIRMWATSSRGAPVAGSARVRWQTTGGRVESQAASTLWILDAVDIDRRYIATVEVDVPSVGAGTCSFGVWVTEGPPMAGDRMDRPGGQRRGEFVTRRAFLKRNDFGEPGFGLYSYFLMREPARAETRQRQARFVRAFLDVLVGVGEQENYVPRRQLNGSYLPVTADPPQGLAGPEQVEWLMQHYDYDRAKSFLSLYPSFTGDGPYILAVPRPLRGSVKPVLPWDFTEVNDQAMADGVSRFLNQAAQLYDWENESGLQMLRDRLLTSVAGMFVGRTTAESLMQIVR